MNVRVAFPETCAPGILRSSQRLAFAILDEQLSVASLDDIAKAEPSIGEGLLGVERKPVVVEAM